MRNYFEATDGRLFDTEEELDEYERELTFRKRMEAMEEEYNAEYVKRPPHYNQGKYECIDVMEGIYGKEAVSNFCLCNAFKYLWRTKEKNGIEDVEKAIWYLNKYKELVK